MTENKECFKLHAYSHAIIITVLFSSIQALIAQELAANPQINTFLDFFFNVNGAPVNNPSFE